MRVYNAYEASPTGGKWGKVGVEVYNDLVLSFNEFELLRVTAGRLSKLTLELLPDKFFTKYVSILDCLCTVFSLNFIQMFPPKSCYDFRRNPSEWAVTALASKLASRLYKNVVTVRLLGFWRFWRLRQEDVINSVTQPKDGQNQFHLRRTCPRSHTRFRL